MNTRKLPLEQLFLHGAWLRRFSCALVHDEDLGDDLSQDTFVKAWQSPPPADAQPRSWLARVAQNRARDLHRSDVRRRKREQEQDEGTEPTQTPEELLGRVELHRKLAALVTALDEPFRHTVVLRYYEGLTAAQIAKRLDVPAGTIRWRLKEGLARVRMALDAEHGGNRKSWVLALTPLVPRTELRRAPSSGRSLWLRSTFAVALVACTSLLIVARRTPQHALDALLPSNTRKIIVAGKHDIDIGPVAPGLPMLVVDQVEDDEPNPHEGPAAADPEALVRYMLTAIAEGSYDNFLTYADNELKAGFLKELMTNAATKYGPRLEEGYTLHSFGTLQQEGQMIHLWKLEFHDGGDDQLLRVTINAGRARSFLIQ